MDNIGQLKTPEDAQRFVFGGNATFTLRSKRTGDRYTFKVTLSENKKVYFVAVLVGPENTSDYSYLGYFKAASKEYVHGGAKAKISADALSARAFKWFVPQLEGMAFHESLEVWHEGKCCVCNRRLTVPASIKMGIGPECAGKMGVAIEQMTFKAEELPLEEPKKEQPKAATKPATKKSNVVSLPLKKEKLPLKRGRK